MTVTTVGYNLQPEVVACEKHLNRLHLILSQSGMGEMTSGMCAICGVFIITCPIPLMVATFSLLYKKRFYRHKTIFCNLLNCTFDACLHPRALLAQRLIRVLLRNQIMARRMQALGSNRTAKEEIIFNLATSGGISGVEFQQQQKD